LPKYANGLDFCTVEYDGWFDDPEAKIKKLQTFLDLPWQQSQADLALVLSGIIDPAAQHDNAGHREAGQPLVRTLYKLAGLPSSAPRSLGSTASKSRLNFLELLRAGRSDYVINPEALTYMRGRAPTTSATSCGRWQCPRRRTRGR
jgi:hypothetical protein